MKFSLSNIILLYIIALLFLSSCSAYGFPINGDVSRSLQDGEVVALHIRATYWGVQQVLSEANFTRVFTDGKEDYLFMWPMQNNVIAWVVYSLKDKGIIETSENIQNTVGNKANVNTFIDLVKCMADHGWQRITPQEVPEWFTTAVTLASTTVISAMDSMPTFVMMINPEGIVPTPVVVQQ
jgi:hypothetical protein